MTSLNGPTFISGPLCVTFTWSPWWPIYSDYTEAAFYHSVLHTRLLYCTYILLYCTITVRIIDLLNLQHYPITVKFNRFIYCEYHYLVIYLFIYFFMGKSVCGGDGGGGEEGGLIILTTSYD